MIYNNSLYANTNGCDKISTKKRYLQGMSIVGIVKTEEGFIAFGDGKSSRELYEGSGIYIEQEGRGVIKKVFGNDNFIMAVHNENQILNLNIENYIEEHIGQKYLYDFIDDFHLFLKKMDTKQNYSFIVARADHEYIYRVEVNQYEIKYIKSDIHYSLGGLISPYFKYICEAVPRCGISSNSKSKEILQRKLNEAYTKLDEDCQKHKIYNPTDNNFSFVSLKRTS